jgi:protein-S-isoprenylcysteine O-methyltransferase Ste14
MHADPAFHRLLLTGLWLAWALYWLIAAADTKTTEQREPLSSRIPYVTSLVLGGILLASHRLPWAWINERLWPRSLALYWTGMALLAGGLAFAVWARVHLGRNWSGAVTLKQGHELIRSGPYGVVRHPIYTGLLLGVVGTAITSGTVRAVLGLIVISAALIVKLRKEERLMRASFPAEYERYRETVPALIPFTKLRRSAPR